MWQSLVRICIGIGVILGGLLAFGIGSIFWKYYTIKRNPVYQTTMTDFEICDEFDENITQKFDKLGINKVDCFIFQGHPQRPSYWIYIVGKCSENAKLPKTYSSHSLEEDITVFTALKLAGAAPDDSENFGEIAARFYRYKNWVVFKMSGEQSPFLFEDADKQAYLEKHIRKRSENKIESKAIICGMFRQIKAGGTAIY